MSRHGNGFTLVELIVSLSIIGIITTMVIPGWKELVVSTRGYTATDSLRTALKYARGEAIMRNQTVRMCASANGATCSISKDWNQGWIIYADNSEKSARTQKDPIIFQQPPIDGLVIKKNGLEKSVKFNSSGWIGLNRSFSICSEDLKPIIRIIVIHSGRIRTDKNRIKCS